MTWNDKEELRFSKLETKVDKMQTQGDKNDVILKSIAGNVRFILRVLIVALVGAAVTGVVNWL